MCTAIPSPALGRSRSSNPLREGHRARVLRSGCVRAPKSSPPDRSWRAQNETYPPIWKSFRVPPPGGRRHVAAIVLDARAQRRADEPAVASEPDGRSDAFGGAREVSTAVDLDHAVRDTGPATRPLMPAQRPRAGVTAAADEAGFEHHPARPLLRRDLCGANLKGRSAAKNTSRPVRATTMSAPIVAGVDQCRTLRARIDVCSPVWWWDPGASRPTHVTSPHSRHAAGPVSGPRSRGSGMR